jgi:hypothetical protein
MKDYINKSRNRSLPPLVNELRKKRQLSEPMDLLSKEFKKLKKAPTSKSKNSVVDHVLTKLGSDNLQPKSSEGVLESTEKKSSKGLEGSIDSRSSEEVDVRESIETWLDDVDTSNNRQESSPFDVESQGRESSLVSGSTESSQVSESPEPNSQFEAFPLYIQNKMELLKESLEQDEQMKSLYLYLESTDKNEAEYATKAALFLENCGDGLSQSLEQSYRSYLKASFITRTNI